MFVSRSIQADHKDLIHDVAYDYYGERLATCSSDQTVKIWDKGEDKLWHCTSSWKTHSGSVWKVTWAHPEFGQIIATCSFDRTVAVWEELGPEGSVGEKSQSQWVKKISLVDSRTPVTDVKFAPKHLGLQLATCSADGVVRVYEAPDIMNLSQWSLHHEIPCKNACSCISWNLSRMHAPMIAVGSDEPSQTGGDKVIIFEYNENTRRWPRIDTLPIKEAVYDLAFAPNLGRSYNLLAVATKNLQIFIIRSLPDQNIGGIPEGTSKYEIRQAGQFDNHNSQVWRVSWNITGTILASSGDDGCVRLWKANFNEKWKCIATMKGDGTTESTEKQSANEPETPAKTDTNNHPTTRYYKLGQVSHLKQEPWH
ncbi:nucleoporin SEH1 [Parasteatoda tepidariorum]|uniref:nucleoporin SEH1 n=1 Tax=Parasteatoda tepidariorum TaxID=114398 RepID=UPI00077FAC1D|nr:nucleoporin SEH1 [Parasteatoda tepidariorum]